MQTTCLDTPVNDLDTTVLYSALKTNGLLSTKPLSSPNKATLYYKDIIVGEFNKLEILPSKTSNLTLINLSCGYLLTPIVIEFKRHNYTLVSAGLIFKDFKILDLSSLENKFAKDKLSFKRLLFSFLQGAWEDC